MCGGRGARLFFGVSDGIVFESYVEECMLRELMLIGLDFLLIGDAGALTVDAFKKRQNSKQCHSLADNHSPTLLNGRNS